MNHSFGPIVLLKEWCPDWQVARIRPGRYRTFPATGLRRRRGHERQQMEPCLGAIATMSAGGAWPRQGGDGGNHG
jgi:hypothetical protein